MSFQYSTFPFQTNSTSATTTTYTLANGSSNTSWVTMTEGTDLKPASLQVNGNSEFKDDANFHGDLKLQGKSLKESLDKIEERLAILRPNEALEEKWEQLRGLRKMYMELEAEIIEKEKMWDILKK